MERIPFHKQRVLNQAKIRCPFSRRSKFCRFENINVPSRRTPPPLHLPMPGQPHRICRLFPSGNNPVLLWLGYCREIKSSDKNQGEYNSRNSNLENFHEMYCVRQEERKCFLFKEK